LLASVDICRAIADALGTPHYLVVSKLANTGSIQKHTSMPTMSLASKRFEVAVLASTTNWSEAGLLSDIHVALLTFDPRGIESAIRESVSRYAFEDSYSGSGVVELIPSTAIVDLGGHASRLDVFRAVSDQLSAAESRLPPDWRTDDRIEAWCLHGRS
jgi:hypothetical protein